MTNTLTDKEILERAIQKAIDGGWKFKVYLFEYEYPNFKQTWNGNIIVATNKNGKAVTINYFELMFDHDFAKALWGEELHHETFIVPKELSNRFAGTKDLDIKPIWQYHLQQMVISDNPIKYLGENL